ncbi:MAG TPA: NmrA family NAD(P)-binding protein [Terriglobales bacterium]|nr:NmrA family NAD(P)-binding protein [Terriglobales bacterium]
MYVVTGASGNTGSVVAHRLLERGKKVRMIARNTERLQSLAARGAEPFAADLTDQAALARAFSGAEAVYAMIPPNPASQDVRGDQRRIVESIAGALEQAHVKHVVSLSSIGADKSSGTGPVSGLHELEEWLNGVPSLNVMHLRAGYFMENTLGQGAAIRAMGKTAGPLRGDLRLPFIATRDIGEVAADVLLKLDFTGRQTRELQGQRDLSYDEVTAIIAKAIEKPEIKYVQLPDEQMQPILVQMGMSPHMAGLILEMSAALNSGHMRALEPRSARTTTPTSYESFVEEVFLPVYKGQVRAA